MQGRSAASICSLLAAAALVAFADGALGADEPRIVKPPDGSWLPGTELAIIAKAADGRLLLDGQPIEAEQPFPNILHARVSVSAGRHSLRLATAEGDQTVLFHAGGPPDGDASPPYAHHPPIATSCSHCHSLSRRGRFRFSGGCQTCHPKEAFIDTHSHEPHELASCGMCHDAHGSSVENLLVLSADAACKQCHN